MHAIVQLVGQDQLAAANVAEETASPKDAHSHLKEQFSS